MALALVLVGLPLLPEAVLVLRRFASLERWRAGRVLGVPIAERYTLTGTLRERLRGRQPLRHLPMRSGCWCRRSSACSSA